MSYQPPNEPGPQDQSWQPPPPHTSYPSQQPFPSQPGWQQSPYPQQPPPPPPPPKKPSFWKRKIAGLPMWLLVLIVIVAIAAVSNAFANNATSNYAAVQNTPTTATTAQNTPTDTPTPTPTIDMSVSGYTPPPTQPPPTWKTTHKFTGNGSKKTAIFSVPDDWKIAWKCNPSSFYGNSYNMIITVYNSDGSYADSGVNAMCKTGNTHDETEEHQSGDVYLDITSEGDWTIQVQELK
jgi:hypothetical protein